MLKAQQKAGIVADVLQRVRVTLVVHQVCRWQFPLAQGETRDFLETDGQSSVNPKLFPVKMMKPFGSPGRGYSEKKAMLTLRWNLQIVLCSVAVAA